MEKICKSKNGLIMKYIEFKNEAKMPLLGLGTWKSEPGEVYQAVKTAVKAGYRHIDCAPIYGNEAEIGRALSELFAEGVVERKDLWITTKLWNNAHAPSDVKPAIEQSLKDLQLDYIDLYLIHWAVAFKPGIVFAMQKDEFATLDEYPLVDTWKAMESLKDEGLAKNIGVCNFGTGNLQLLLENCNHKPEMNQVELHPYLQQRELHDFCLENDIHMTAYSPFGSPDRQAQMKADDEPSLFEDYILKEIAESKNTTPAGVILAWVISRDICVIPKSVNEGRMKQNLTSENIVLDQEDIDKIEAITKNYRYVKGDFFTRNGSPYTLEDVWR